MTWHTFVPSRHDHLIRYFVNRYRWAVNTGRICESDLWQVGRLGLMRAVSMFDPSRGWKLETYARRWIQNHMQRIVDADSYPVHYPNHVLWDKTQNAYGKFGVSLDSDRRSANDESSTPLKDRIKSQWPQTDAQLLAFERDRRMVYLAEDITKQIRLRAGERNAEVLLRWAQGETLQDIAVSVGVTRERARQIRNAALAKCRTIPAFKQLREVLEVA